MTRPSQKMQIQWINLDKLIPYARNPRKNDNAVSKTAGSIKEFGWKQPVVVDKDYVDIAVRRWQEFTGKLPCLNGKEMNLTT